MVIFGHRRGGGGVQPSKNPKITFFLGKIFKFQGEGGPDPRPPSGSAHVSLVNSNSVNETLKQLLNYFLFATSF